LRRRRRRRSVLVYSIKYKGRRNFDACYRSQG